MLKVLKVFIEGRHFLLQNCEGLKIVSEGQKNSFWRSFYEMLVVKEHVEGRNFQIFLPEGVEGVAEGTWRQKKTAEGLFWTSFKYLQTAEGPEGFMHVS